LALVSIIVPAYNAAETLLTSIESLLIQSLKEIEVIIVNDASDDDTLIIAKKLAGKDSRINVIDSLENLGVYKARALGIEAATAPWIGFLDADDFAKPTMYQRLFDAAERYNTDIVVCEADRVTPERQKISKRVSLKHNGLLKNDFFRAYCRQELGTDALWNKLYRASLIKKWGTVNHPFRQNNHEDAIINFGCFHDANSVFLLKSSLYEYAYNSKSVTSTITTSAAFTSMISAYFLTMSIYQNLDKRSLNQITEHYRIQLEWPVYTPDTLELSEEQLKKLMPLFVSCVQENPEALYALLLRRPIKRNRSVIAKIRGLFR
jgi:glycosyltransferase involved in cell wall biosynthesis